MATTLVDACAQNRKMELAETLFDDLFGEFVEPDDVAFCSLIRGFSSEKDVSWEDIERIVEGMEKKFCVTPTINVYNALLEICAQHNDVDQAEEIIDQMATENISPDEMTMQLVKQRRSMRKLVRQLARELETLRSL